jgi:ribose transport system ATP-binding protein
MSTELNKSVSAPVLRVLDVKKSFAGTQALTGVSFELSGGSIHALLGGNGSGKSTMIKILAGVYDADDGQLELRGERLDARAMTPTRARAMGLRFVHQQQAIFPELTVAENLAIGHGFQTGRGGRIRWRTIRRRSREVLDRFHIDADPSLDLGELSPSQQAMVAIARALQDQEGEHESVLVLDEPTASLPASEVDLLLSALKRYAADGQTILYVTHRLREVLQVADRATIFRDGRMVATVESSEMDHDSLVELIMGRRVEQLLSRSNSKVVGNPVLQVDNLAGGPVHDASFALQAGEIIGIGGLLGAGRSTLLKLLFGVIPIEAGTVRLDGKRVTLASPRHAMAAGISYQPEDRLTDAAFTDMSVVENLGMATTREFFRMGRLHHRAEHREARAIIDTFQIKASSLNAPFTSMSGGNQQKVVLARWLRRTPRLLLLDEPTQGVDVGARAEIWQLVRRAVNQGATALVVSSDLEELSRVCDRVLILRAGRIEAELAGSDLTEDRLDHLTLTATAKVSS